MPNLTQQAYSRNLELEHESGFRAGVIEGRQQAWADARAKILESKMRLLNTMCTAMQAQSSAMEYVARTMGQMEDLFK